MPANAIWPSDSWPAQPVSTVSDSAADREARAMRGVEQVPRRLRDDERQRRPRRASTQQARARSRLPHPPDVAAAARGSVATFGRERERLRLRRRLRGSGSTTATSTARSSRKSMRPGWSRKLKLTTRLDDADARCRRRARAGTTPCRRSPPRPGRGRACSGRACARSLRRAASSAADQRSSTAWPANPAIAHTSVDTSFGLMPGSRARSGFSADALTVLPTSVRLRNQPRATATTAARRRGSTSCAPVTRTPTDVVHVASDRRRERRAAVGRSRGTRSGSPATSCAMPMVATSTMTRGASNSRRIDDQLDERAEERADDERSRRRRARTGTP